MSRNYRRRESGQSLPLIALMIVVIVAMVGLSVDVGNAYGQQRRMQNAANAGALAGMNSVMANQRNQDVWTNVQRTMAGNRVDNSGAQYSYRADYVLENGSVVMLGSWNGSTAYVPNGSQSVPSNVVRVQVTISERVDTYFARVVGQNDLTVNANGNACVGGYGLGVYPLGIPLNLKKTVSGNGNQPDQVYHRIYRSNGSELPNTSGDWGNWDKMKGMTLHLPVDNWSQDMSGTHISWLSWTGGNGASELDAGMTYPGTLQDGFVEGIELDASTPNTKPLKQLTLGDWVNGDTGVKASLKDELDAHKVKDRDLILPIYDKAGKQGGVTSFHVVKMGVFRIKEYAFTGSPKYINVQYLGDAKTRPSLCASERDPDDSYEAAKRFNVEGTTKVNRVWSTKSESAATYDIVLVMDTSASMQFDWSDDRPGTAGYDGRPRIEDAKKSIVEFVQGFDIAGDPDARMAFVTFGGTGANASRIQNNWTTSGCSTAEIAANACTTDKKWSSIQTKAKSMTTNGYTPGPIAFETVEELLRNKRTAAAGKQYRQIVLFATDGVFNICGSDRGAQNCPYGKVVPSDKSSNDPEYYLNNPAYNMVSGRPIWQAQQVASRIKNSGARVFVIALTPRGGDFNPAGLPEMSSGTGYYYEADDSGAMANIYAQIKEKIEGDRCQPMEVWQPAGGAQIKLTQPSNPTFLKTVVADTNGQWKISDLEAGQYVVKSDPVTITSHEDSKTRKYSRIRNGFNLSEENQASININPQYPNGATVYSELLLSLPVGPDNVPLNGCNTP